MINLTFEHVCKVHTLNYPARNASHARLAMAGVEPPIAS